MNTSSPIWRIAGPCAALVLGLTSLSAQNTQPNILSGDMMTAGPARTGHTSGFFPVGGPNGSIATNTPGATHEKLAFHRGVIPTVANGGPELVEVVIQPILNEPSEHIQDIEPIGDWSQGAAYFAVTHSQDNSGHFFVLKTSRVAPAPNEHEVIGLQGGVAGQGVWYQKMTMISPMGAYNHPGDMSAVGDILVIAGQNWPGHPLFPLQIAPGAPPDAVLFFDVSNPENVTYLGKMPITTIAPVLSDLSNLWAGKIGDHYYLSMGDGNRTVYLYSNTFLPSAATWSVAQASSSGFIGDTIVSVHGEGNPTPVQWSVSPGVDDYQITSVRSLNGGQALAFGPDLLTMDVEDSAFPAKGSGSGVYISPRGRMTQVSIDRGFKGGFISLESYSIHYTTNDVVKPPTSPLLPLGDSAFWGTHPSYYTTIQRADLDGDGADEIIARWSAGLVAWKGDGTPLPGTIGLADPAWKNPEYYSVIQVADIDGDGRDEVLARFSQGLVAFSHDGQGWTQLPGLIGLTDAGGFNQPEYYRTIQTADIDGDGRAEVLARFAYGFFAFSFDGFKWTQRSGSMPLSDASGFNKPEYYETIQTADLNGDGLDEVIGRAAAGLYAYTYFGGAWVQMGGYLGLTNAAGFNQARYYETIQAADIDGDGRDEVLVRYAAGFNAFAHTGANWVQMPDSITLLSNAAGFSAPQNYKTIKTADFDGDGKAEVFARYFWGIATFSYDQSQWTQTSTTMYPGDYNRYDMEPNYSTIQSMDTDGDGRDELAMRLRTGLYLWTADDMGIPRALPVGVKRIGSPTTCQAPAPSLNVNGIPYPARLDFRLIAEDAPPQAVGLLALAGSGSSTGIPVLGALMHVNIFSPSFFGVTIASDPNGRFSTILPIRGLSKAQFYLQAVWLNPAPCSGRFLSSSAALELSVR